MIKMHVVVIIPLRLSSYLYNITFLHWSLLNDQMLRLVNKNKKKCLCRTFRSVVTQYITYRHNTRTHTIQIIAQLTGNWLPRLHVATPTGTTYPCSSGLLLNLFWLPCIFIAPAAGLGFCNFTTAGYAGYYTLVAEVPGNFSIYHQYLCWLLAGYHVVS